MSREVLLRFLQFLEFDTNVSRNTVVAYNSDIEQFFSSVGKQEPSDLTSSDILSYLSTLRDVNQCSDNTIKRKLASLRRFFRFLQDSGLVTDPKMLRIGLRFRTPARLPKVMPLSDVSRLLSAAKTCGSAKGYGRYKRVRDHLMISLLFYTGMRVGELVGLNVDDVERDSGTIRVHGKGGKERILYVRNQGLESALRIHSILRPKMPSVSEAMFVNRTGNRLSSRSVEETFRGCLSRAGITGEYTPHSMRHTMATILLERGTSIRAVQETLGHSSVLSTQIYTHVAPRQVEEALAMLGQIRLK